METQLENEIDEQNREDADQEAKDEMAKFWGDDNGTDGIEDEDYEHLRELQKQQ